MPPGTVCLNFPFGPWTSTALSSSVMVTPLGIVISFFPIRDILFLSSQLTVHSSQFCQLSTVDCQLPNITEHLAADAHLDCFAARHHAARGRQNARAKPGQHLRHIIAAEIHAAAR